MLATFTRPAARVNPNRQYAPHIRLYSHLLRARAELDAFQAQHDCMEHGFTHRDLTALVVLLEMVTSLMEGDVPGDAGSAMREAEEEAYALADE